MVFMENLQILVVAQGHLMLGQDQAEALQEVGLKVEALQEVDLEAAESINFF